MQNENIDHWLQMIYDLQHKPEHMVGQMVRKVSVQIDFCPHIELWANIFIYFEDRLIFSCVTNNIARSLKDGYKDLETEFD